MERSETDDLKSSDAISIAFAVPTDAAGIAAVHKESCLLAYPNTERCITEGDIAGIDFDSPDKIALWAARAETKRSEKMWVVKNDKRVIGFCFATKLAKINRLYSIYLLSECKNKGLGTRLLTLSMDWLGTKKDINLWVAPYNDAAIRIYERFGFLRSGETDTWSPVENNPTMHIPLIEMKRIRPKSQFTVWWQRLSILFDMGGLQPLVRELRK